MATFTVIDAAQAPAQPKTGTSRLLKRMAEYEGYVNSMKPGKVGKLELSPGETMRGVGLRVSRAGKRLGRSVDVWYGDGVVYFKVG